MMNQFSKRVAIYGGAFSPPHVGHASVIEAVLRLFPCDEIWVMPSADRRDKTISAPAEHRIKMLEIMIEDCFSDSKISIIISSIEIDRNKPTTTFDTMNELRSKYPHFDFYFVVGSDQLGQIEEKWIDGKELYEQLNFVAVKNPLSPLPSKLPRHLTLLDDITWVSTSSTFIRNLISQGHSGIPYLLPRIAEYIKTKRLYR